MEVIIGEVGGICGLKGGLNWLDLVHSHVNLESQKLILVGSVIWESFYLSRFTCSKAGLAVLGFCLTGLHSNASLSALR